MRAENFICLTTYIGDSLFEIQCGTYLSMNMRVVSVVSTATIAQVTLLTEPGMGSD
jgi:hypothetical protein